MHQGRIEQAGPPMEVYRRPATRFVAEFVGSPPMNFVDGTLSDDGLQLGTTRLPWPPAAAPEAATQARPVAVGLRPEDIAVNADDAATRDNAWLGEADVELVQPMGAETLLQCRWESHRLTVALRHLSPPGRGERVALTIARDALHLFDANTGQRVDPSHRSA
jgi:sn-glycerol 3-phosphate transport system ATP-binding protein